MIVAVMLRNTLPKTILNNNSQDTGAAPAAAARMHDDNGTGVDCHPSRHLLSSNNITVFGLCEPSTIGVLLRVH
jgi:hypothetical protein